MTDRTQSPMVVAELAKDQDGNPIFKVRAKMDPPPTEPVFVNIGYYRKLDGSPLAPEQEAKARERDRADLERAMRTTEKEPKNA